MLYYRKCQITLYHDLRWKVGLNEFYEIPFQSKFFLRISSFPSKHHLFQRISKIRPKFNEFLSLKSVVNLSESFHEVLMITSKSEKIENNLQCLASSCFFSSGGSGFSKLDVTPKMQHYYDTSV